jgi:KipI family sensor histidine kinase inhibitor
MILLPFGDRALLVECDDLASAQRAHRALAARPLDGLRELVPGGRTVLVRVDPRVVGLTHLEHWVRSVLEEAASQNEPLSGEPIDAAAVSIPVMYDGEDLATVATAWGCSVDEVIARHAATEWVCAFVGFAPGFPYLVPAGGEATALPTVPRRATSRQAVPTGSVALAAEYCGVYPRESPGGWQLIGRTDAVLWDARREPPALVTAGTRVRFMPVRELGRAAFADRPGALTETPAVEALRVLEPGSLTLVQDRGRPGLAAIGVGTSGAFDRGAHRLANRLVGNDDDAATLEVLLGGAAFALPLGSWVAVTGADGPITLDDAPVVPAHAVRAERDGAILRVGPATRGLRFAVAVRGGIASAPLLGSRSRDTLAGIGPLPLRAGDTVEIGAAIERPVPAVDHIPMDAAPHTLAELSVRPGPRHGWFTADAWSDLLQEEWTVSARADRTGVRLEGRRLVRRTEFAGRELASEGMTAGAIQVSPDGVPTILGPDHPVTGGYPVIAVVTDDTLDRLAQLRPGQRLRLRLATGRP